MTLNVIVDDIGFVLVEPKCGPKINQKSLCHGQM